MNEAPDERRSPGAWRAASVGAGVTGGWILHDLAVFLASGEPSLANEILPGSITRSGK